MNTKCMHRPQAIRARPYHGVKLAITLLLLVMIAAVAMPALAQQTKTTVTYVYTNAQGTPLAEADAQGNIIARYTYRPYGVQQSGPENSGPGYTGHVHDPATGLVYMQQRYYSPIVGRFLSPDPIAPTPGNVFNFGRYIYANDNPYRYTDPDGRSVLEFLAGLEYETYSAVTGHGFHGHRLLGALKDGYNGEGAGVSGALKQDAGIVITVATLGAAGAEVGTAEAGSEVLGDGSTAIAADAGGDLGNEIGILRDASKGKGNFGLGNATKDEADKIGKAWVGDDHIVAKDGKTLISKDGLRQYRPPTNKPRLGKAQANLERRIENQKTKQWFGNGHIDIKD